MAEIWVAPVCDLCGGVISPGQKHLLIVEVKVTSEGSHHNPPPFEGALRVNFFTGSSRKLRHLTCPSS